MDSIEKILMYDDANIPALSFTINFIISVFLSSILSFLYKNYSFVLSNKESFSKNLIFVSCTTMVIITIVKSSLALSLGLVGALSIIRFRTAIKEPEELSYLFIAIAIGLGIGADQIFITIISFFLTSTLIIVLFYFSGAKVADKNMFLTINYDGIDLPNIDEISNILNANCAFIKLRRYDSSNDNFEAIFLIQLTHKESLTKIQKRLKELNQSISISFLNQDNPVL